MRLITVEQWRTQYFKEGSRPSDRTVRRWLRNNKVPAKKVGGSWYIDEHRWLSEGDGLVEGVLAG